MALALQTYLIPDYTLASAFSSAKCEKLQKEKEELELRFEEEVRRLGWQQQVELQELEERLQLQFQAELARLGEEHGAQLLRIQGQHQRQVSAQAHPFHIRQARTSLASTHLVQ